MLREEPDLEVQVQDVMLMEVMDTLTDLLGEQDHIQFSQVVLLFCDPVKELTPIHTARAKEEGDSDRARLSDDWPTHQGRQGYHCHLGFYGGPWGRGGQALVYSQLRVWVIKRK